MNKSIAQTIGLLFVLMLVTALSVVWLKCVYLSVVGGIGTLITWLILYDMYEIKAKLRREHAQLWKIAEHEERWKRLKADEMFATYDYATRDWNKDNG